MVSPKQQLNRHSQAKFIDKQTGSTVSIQLDLTLQKTNKRLKMLAKKKQLKTK